MQTNYPGIDYGLGRTNINKDTGIRYGVISQRTVGEAWYERAEADYGKPTCPKCGNDVAIVLDLTEEQKDWDAAEHECADYACPSCKYLFGSESAFGDEPLGWSFDDSEYTLTDCLDSDVFVLKSPYYTFAQFCSPCVPGAINLDHPMPSLDEACKTGEACGIKGYCLGHDWFEEGKAPYTVYSVADDSVVLPS